MPKDYWVTCQTCEHQWIDQLEAEMGLLFGDLKCPECTSEDVEAEREYHG